MDSKRDDLLNDLIEYYDNEPDSLDETIVMKPMSELMQEDEDEMGHTTVVCGISATDGGSADGFGDTISVPSIPHRPAPEEEIFGNLDITGKRMEIPRPAPAPVYIRDEHGDVDVPSMRKRKSMTLEAPLTRPKGVWYKLKPLWVTMMICIVLFSAFKFYMTDTGIIGTYKRNFSYNMSLILRTLGVEKSDEVDEYEIGGITEDFFTATGLSVTAYARENEPPVYKTNARVQATVPMPGAKNAQFAVYDDGIVCARSNYICFITKKGDKKWEYQTPISQPILATAGKYIAIAGKGSTQLCLYKGKELLYQVEVAHSIKTCSVSEKGDVAVVTDKTAYKGAVSVFNAKGEEVFSWISGVNYITSATVTKNRQVSVSLVSTEKDVKSYVMVFDIYSTDPIGGSEFQNSLIFKIDSFKNYTYAFADNAISGVNANGATFFNNAFSSNVYITHTANDDYGWTAVSYTDNHLPYMKVFNKKGRLKYSIDIEASPDHLSLYKGYVAYNNGRDIISGKANANKKSIYSAPMSVKNLVMLDKDTYVVAYDNNIQFINF